MGGVLAWLDDSRTTLLRTGEASGWSSFANGDRALTVDHGVTNGQYHQPHEYYDMTHYPSDWRSPEYEPESAVEWAKPRETATGPFLRIAPKGIAGISMANVAAAAPMHD